MGEDHFNNAINLDVLYHAEEIPQKPPLLALSDAIHYNYSSFSFIESKLVKAKALIISFLILSRPVLFKIKIEPS